MEPVQPPNALVRLERRPSLRRAGWQHDWPDEAQEAEPAPWRMLVLISLRVLPSRRPPAARRSLSPSLRRSRAAWQRAARRERRSGVRRFVAIAALLTVLTILGAGLIDSDDAGPGSAEGAAAPSAPFLT